MCQIDPGKEEEEEEEWNKRSIGTFVLIIFNLSVRAA